jgi:hypothetical protein
LWYYKKGKEVFKLDDEHVWLIEKRLERLGCEWGEWLIEEEQKGTWIRDEFAGWSRRSGTGMGGDAKSLWVGFL